MAISDELKAFLFILCTFWILAGLLVGAGFALTDGKCPYKNIAAYLNPAYIVSCEILKPRWNE